MCLKFSLNCVFWQNGALRYEQRFPILQECEQFQYKFVLIVQNLFGILCAAFSNALELRIISLLACSC
jgi:hypothetical protein